MSLFPRARLLLLGGAGALAAAGLGGYALAAHAPTPATIHAVQAAATVPAPATPADTDGPNGPKDQQGPDQPDPAGEAANEKAGSDGPGGHADEPSNPGANHQAEGAE